MQAAASNSSVLMYRILHRPYLGVFAHNLAIMEVILVKRPEGGNGKV